METGKKRKETSPVQSSTPKRRSQKRNKDRCSRKLFYSNQQLLEISSEVSSSDFESDNGEQPELSLDTHLAAEEGVIKMSKDKEVEELKATILKGKKADIGQLALLIIDLHTNNAQLLKALDEANKKLDDLENKMKLQDIYMAKKGVIIKGLQDTPQETSRDLYNKMDNLVNEKMKMNFHIDMVRRIPLSKKIIDERKQNQEPVTRPVLLRFSNPFEKFKFLGQIKNHTNEFTGISIQNEIPVCLKDAHKVLVDKGYHERKASGAKTRIAWSGNDLVLKVKKEGQKNFEIAP